MERALNEVNRILSDTFIDIVKHKVRKMYLVGGSLRDAYYGRKVKDFDFVLSHEDFITVAEFIDKSSLSHFTLNSGRLKLLRTFQGELTFDFMILSGTLEEDFERRDFTLNTLYYDLKSNELIQFGSAFQDLASKLLKVVSAHSIEDDPVRALRGIRLIGTFNLEVGKESVKMLRKGMNLLTNVKKERIREELKQLVHIGDANLINALEIVFGEHFGDILEKLNVAEDFTVLDREINVGFSYRDILRVAFLVRRFPILLCGFSGRELKVLEKTINTKVSTTFESLFDMYIRSRSLPEALLVILMNFEGDSALKFGRMIEQWHTVKVDGNRIKGIATSGKERGIIKENIQKTELRKMYDKV